MLMMLLAVACTDTGHPSAVPEAAPAPAHGVADPADGITTELDGTAPEFVDAVVAELAGDEPAARAAFERVLAATDAPPPLAARAALHLAQLDARVAGKSRHALDLVARAAALAPSDPAITEGVAQVQANVVAASGAGDLRGPKAGTILPGLDPTLAEAFATAERALARVHAIRPQQRLEVWAKEDATEDVVAKYRVVAEHGGLAQVAADYRTGSLYHDLALGLLFELPPELDPNVAAGPAPLAYCKSAAASYRASLGEPVDARRRAVAARRRDRSAQRARRARRGR